MNNNYLFKLFVKLNGKRLASKLKKEQQERDDVSSIPYRPFVVDYMKDVFRRKVFVKQSEPSECQHPAVQKEVNTVTPIYTSIYGEIGVGEPQKRDFKRETDPSEDEQAAKLLERIREIEKAHEASVDPEKVVEVSYPEFKLNHCSCPECSPRFLEDGSLYCDLCKIPLMQEDWCHHERSISHQLRRKQEDHLYINSFIHPDSTAAKWMMSMGWKEGEGLGENGRGRLEPIPTRLKNNRLGIGAEDDMYGCY